MHVIFKLSNVEHNLHVNWKLDFKGRGKERCNEMDLEWLRWKKDREREKEGWTCISRDVSLLPSDIGLHE